MDEIERRNFDAELRAEVDPEGKKIRGTAAVYNKWSEDLGGFKEMIEPGFFENVLKNDVRALWNHNDDMVLGRTKAGTLKLNDTERGLDIEIDPPDTSAGRDAMVSIGRRDVDQMSFAFMVREGGDEWIREKNGSIKRILKRGGAAKLMDVSPVAFPAYPATSVHVRSMVDQLTEEGQAPDPEEEPKGSQARARMANRKRLLEIKIKQGELK